jgi:alkylhydroperoxidase family enzyme
MHKFEKIAGSFWGRIIRPLLARKIRDMALTKIDALPDKTDSFAGRSLECDPCQAETRDMSLIQGFTESEFDHCLSSLTSHKLNTQESKVLSWTRETVHCQTGTVQKQTRALAQEVDEEVLLEAIGVAALANTTVRLAMLLE